METNQYTPEKQEYSFNGIIQIDDKEFHLISALVYEKFGIHLTDKKKALVRGRLNKLIRGLGYTSFQQYYDSILDDKTGRSLLDLVDKISTNHSYFFRENEHFDFLETVVLPKVEEKLKSENSSDLRIWCAGCAAGEEPYTLAMVLLEHFGASFFYGNPGVLATDISLSALSQAAEGVYTPDRVQAVPHYYKSKYFTQTADGMFKIKNDLKKMILFKRLNLMRPEFPFKGKFHVIFCRNVMIYFDGPTKTDLVAKFHNFLVDDGHLFVGHSESLGRGSGIFQYIQPAVYSKINGV
jgi:chemotaxis protein methyltransferase CheR